MTACPSPHTSLTLPTQLQIKRHCKLSLLPLLLPISLFTQSFSLSLSFCRCLSLSFPPSLSPSLSLSLTPLCICMTAYFIMPPPSFYHLCICISFTFFYPLSRVPSSSLSFSLSLSLSLPLSLSPPSHSFCSTLIHLSFTQFNLPLHKNLPFKCLRASVPAHRCVLAHTDETSLNSVVTATVERRREKGKIRLTPAGSEGFSDRVLLFTAQDSQHLLASGGKKGRREKN